MTHHDEKARRASQPRMILVDDNIRDVGGHYYELATLLLGGAEELGLKNVLATNASFHQLDAVSPNWQLVPLFHTRRMVRWSLGIDGDSHFQRDFAGRVVGASRLDRVRSAITDLWAPPKKRPQRMLRQWASDLSRLLEQVKPSSADTLLINTGDDFAMLALADAMQRAGNRIPPIRIDVIFHFALYESGQSDRQERLASIGRQLRSALVALQPHSVHLHATTDALAAQLEETQCGIPINSIPYPTRQRVVAKNPSSRRIKAVLAGLPRAEKGRGAIADFLAGVAEPHLSGGRYQVSMQMPANRWQTMIPASLHDHYQSALNGNVDGPLDVMTSNLSTTAYHEWLDTADLGLFLYDPERYVARCSGVLLEMMARGVPVIVPDGCWLADQVRLAGGHQSIGLIYQDRREIPRLMQQFAEQRDEITHRSIAHAATIAARHHGHNTLVQMGISSSRQTQAA